MLHVWRVALQEATEAERENVITSTSSDSPFTTRDSRCDMVMVYAVPAFCKWCITWLVVFGRSFVRIRSTRTTSRGPYSNGSSSTKHRFVDRWRLAPEEREVNLLYHSRPAVRVGVGSCGGLELHSVRGIGGGTSTTARDQRQILRKTDAVSMYLVTVQYE